MIKLENSSHLPQAVAFLSLVSSGDVPAIALKVEGARSNVQGQWVDDAAFKTQRVVSLVAGEAFELTGKVAESDAVEIGSAWRVVVEVGVDVMLTQAFAKGDRSREIASLTLKRVVEVWSGPNKKLWSAAPAKETSRAAEFDPATGKIGGAK